MSKQMYKVFLNDRLIRIDAPGKIILNKTGVVFDSSCTSVEIERWFQGFHAAGSREAILIHPDPDRFFRLFRSAFIEIKAAGGMVTEADRLLFIFRRGKWDLPKGKMDDGEIPEETALREVGEETGLEGHRIVQSLPSTYHIYPSPRSETKNQWIFKETFWFEMSCSDRKNLTPQQEEGITEVRWVERKKLDGVLANTYENLKQIILLYRD